MKSQFDVFTKQSEELPQTFKIKRVIKSFKQLDKAAKFHNETNCCGVIALASVCEVSFGKAHGVLKRDGREDKAGTFTVLIERAVHALGGSLLLRDELAGKSVSKVMELRPDDTLLVLVSGGDHIAAIKAGKIQDHEKLTSGRSKCTAVWSVSQDWKGEQA